MSILKSFRNLKLSLLVALLLLGLVALSLLNLDLDLEKIDLSKALQKQSNKTLKFDLNGGNTSLQLLKEHHHYMDVNYEKIQNLCDKDLIKNFMMPQSLESSSLKTLGDSIKSLQALSANYYKGTNVDGLGMIKQAQKKLFRDANHFNDTVIVDMSYKNRLTRYVTLVNLVNILLIFLWYSRKLTLVYRDVKLILNVDEDERDKNFKTTEFKAIKRRMERRPLASGGKNLLDSLTGLLNEKGLVSEYVQRNSGSSKEFVCVTIFDIDNFKDLGQQHGKVFTDTVIKKLAFIMNLEKKASDILGRIGEDQFIMITPRENQEEAFTTAEGIRKSIEKTIFKSSMGKISVTVSAGFTPKDKHEKIESAIATANTLVKRAKVKGKNTIVKQQGFNSDRNLRM